MTKPTTVEEILETYAFETNGEMDCGHDGDFDKTKAKAALATAILGCVPKEKKTQGNVFATPTGGISNMGASYFHAQGYNACREEVLKNLQEVLK